MKRVFGNPIIGLWYCSNKHNISKPYDNNGVVQINGEATSTELFPRQLEECQEEFKWEANSDFLVTGYTYPCCPVCGTMLQYDEAE